MYVFIEYKYISVHDISSPTSSVLYGTFLLLALKDYNTVVLCGDPALFELGAPLRTFYERS